MLSYIGGKSKIGKWIVPFYDKDMETYVETFGGMFWCFFNMDLKQFPNLKKVVYNDFNPLNHNLFQCVKNPQRLLEAINAIPCQQLGEFETPSIYKEQFVRFQAEIFAENFSVQPGNYEIAAKYGRKIKTLPLWLVRMVAKVGDWIPGFPLNSYRLGKLFNS